MDKGPIEIIDERPKAARILAQEALDIQLGSVEDAIALVEDFDFGNPLFTEMIITAIRQIGKGEADNQ